MASLKTPVCEFGKKAINFDLGGIDNDHWSLQECRGENGLLVMFISNHCPYVKAIREKLVRDTTELIELGVNSVAIMSNDAQAYPEDSLENMRLVSSQYKFPFPYLIDPTQKVARAYGAVCTPDFFGYNANLELQYRGRLDASGPSTDFEAPERELFKAMKQIAASGRGPEIQVPSIGCSIKWR
jgi:peroxiredoxin